MYACSIINVQLSLCAYIIRCNSAHLYFMCTAVTEGSGLAVTSTLREFESTQSSRHVSMIMTTSTPHLSPTPSYSTSILPSSSSVDASESTVSLIGSSSTLSSSFPSAIETTSTTAFVIPSPTIMETNAVSIT